MPDAHHASDNFVDLGGDSEGDSNADDNDELEQMLTTPASKRKRTMQQMAEEAPVEIEEDSDDDVRPSTQRSRRRGAQSKVSNGHSVTDESSDDDDDDVPLPSSRRSHSSRRPRSPDVLDADENVSPSQESGQDEFHTPRQHRRLRNAAEQQELEDDLLDLRSSGDDDEPPFHQARRSKTASEKEKRQNALEKLKRRRAGLSTRSGETEHVNAEDDFEEDDVDANEDEDEDEEPLPQSSARAIFDHDEDDDVFVVTEEDDTLGVPTDIPLAFTQYASMKASQLFKWAVDWMVQKRVNPGFSGTDEIYELTFKKLDDEVKGLAGSKFISSAWTQDFLFTLKARPEVAISSIDLTSVDLLMRDRCDACNRSKHPATYDIQFLGRPYYKETLNEVGDPDDSDSNSDLESKEHAPARDEKGRKIEPEAKIFHVGK